jgi:hypothetical protein
LKQRSLSLRVIILFIFIACIVQTGCKENTIVNSAVSPSNNSIGVWDTSLPCVTHTYYDDTAITSTNIGGISIYQGVGTVTDPFFGTMTGATYFQVVPTDFTSAIYTDNTIDSAVLVLPYSGFTYGDTQNQSLTQTYQVFYLQDTMSITSTYFSYSSKPVDQTTPLSDPVSVNIYHLQDSFGVNVMAANYPGLRIKLKLDVLKGHLLPALNNLATSTSPTADFLSAFKGICVRVADPTITNSAIPYFRLDGNTIYSTAGILVYYHKGTGAVTDTLIEPYYFNRGSCAHFNSVTKSYSSAPVNALIHSTQPGDTIVALQNLPGASIDLIVPGIKGLPAGIINKAELQLTLLPGSYNPGTYFSPERLYPIGVANGTYPFSLGFNQQYNVADRYPIDRISPFNVLDGSMHSYVRNGTTVNTFTIDIPREVMASVAAKNDTIHLHISGTQDFYGAFHMVAGGGNYSNPIYRAKLFVVYSKLKN